MEVRDNYKGLDESLKKLILQGKQIGGFAWNKRVYDTVPVFLFGYTGYLIHRYKVIARGLGTARFEHFSIEDPRINQVIKKDGTK